MGIDTSDPDHPYWYIFGFYVYAEGCKRTPKIFNKIIPFMKWIQDLMLV